MRTDDGGTPYRVCLAVPEASLGPGRREIWELSGISIEALMAESLVILASRKDASLRFYTA